MPAQTIIHQVTAPAGTSWCEDALINGLFAQINQDRAQNNVPALSMDPLGMKDADLRAIQFAAYMFTNPPGTLGFNPHQGYDTTAANLGYSIVSEDLAYQNLTPSYIVYLIWQDPLHLAAMLSTQANVAGVSCLYANGGIPYWTYEPGYNAVPPSPGATPTLDAEETAFLNLLNSYRAQNGAGPLQVSIALEKSSLWDSNDMAANNYAGHTDSLGRTPGVRLSAFGYPYFPWGENIAGGYADAQTTFTSLQNACDPDANGNCTYAHRMNMLNPSFVVTGIGRAYNGSSAYGWYWTNDFGGYLDPVLPATPPSLPAISSFLATPSTTQPGQPVTLSWNTSGASTLVIDQGIGDVSNRTSITVNPNVNTTFTLTASNLSGNVSARVSVSIAAANDTQPPTAPSSLSAVAITSGGVALAWGASTDNVGVAGYQIFRNGGALLSVPNLPLSYSDIHTSPSTTYTYYLKAYDAAGNYSSPSNSIQVTTSSVLPPPTAPPTISSFLGTPSTVAPGQPVSLSWITLGATTLMLDHGIGDVSTRTAITVNPTVNTIYTLTAVNNLGSATARFIVWINPYADNQPPTAPSSLTAVAIASGGVTLAWGASNDDVGVAGYQIFRNGSALISVSSLPLSYSDLGASPSTTYTYFAKAFDAAGNYSGPSNSVSVTTSNVSPTPATCSPATNAFTGCYFNNVTLSGTPTLIRTDSAINFNWSYSSPAPVIAGQNYSVRWLGNFTFAQGDYTFAAITSDGMRIYIDGQIVLDRWRDQPPYQYTIRQTLSQGTHLVTVEYYDGPTGASQAQLSWRKN
jgi:uncharacterized protein YkwD/chitodextrinase